jgi:hypothetical protein
MTASAGSPGSAADQPGSSASGTAAVPRIATAGQTAVPAKLPGPVPAGPLALAIYTRQAGVGAILVEKAWSAPWMRVFSRMGMRSTSVGGMIIYS